MKTKPSGCYTLLNAMTNPHNMCEIKKVKTIVPNMNNRLHELRQMGCVIDRSHCWLELLYKPENVILDNKNKRVLSGYFSEEQRNKRDMDRIEREYSAEFDERIKELEKQIEEVQSVVEEEIKNLSFFKKIGFYIYRFIYNLIK